MRLLFCFLASLALHAFFVHVRSRTPAPPQLTLSLEPKRLAVRMRTQVKRKVVAPLPEKKISPKKSSPPEREVRKEKAPVPTPKPSPVKKKRVVKKKIVPPRPPKKIGRPKSEPAEPVVKPQPVSTSTPVKKPRLIERAEYLNNPPPRYPEQSRRRRQQGKVLLLVDITAQGAVERLQIQKSSGFTALDNAAKKAVAQWRFTPMTDGGRTIQSQVLVPVVFTLTR